MNEPRDQFNPADFWPDAERMLDKHFRRKRIVKLTIAAAFVSALLGIVAFWAVNVPAGTDVQTVVDQAQRERSNEVNVPVHKSTPKAASQTETSLNNTEPENTSALHLKATESKGIGTNAPIKKGNDRQINEAPSRPLKYDETIERNSGTGQKKRESKQDIRQTKQGQKQTETPVHPYQEQASNRQKLNQSELGLPVLGLVKSPNMQGSPTAMTGLNELKPLNLLESSRPEIQNIVVPEYQDEKKKRFPQSWNLEVNWGVMWNFVNHQGGSEAYRMRRDEEEQVAYTFTQGIGVRKMMGKWSVYGGVERNAYGENTNYNNTVDGEIPNVQSTVNLSYDSSLINRNIYYLGNEFQESILVINTDSLITYDTLFNAGSVSGNLPDGYSGGRNRYTYFEIPVSMAYSFWKSRRLSVDGFAGISLGILQQARGNMLNGENTAFLDLRNKETLNTYLMNYRGGLSLHYGFINGISVSLSAEYRGMARSIHTGQSGLNSRYNNVGILLGLSYSISQRP